MIKKDIFGKDIKKQFRASARDRIYSFMMAEQTIRGSVVHATRMINEMRANHELGPLETLILGQAYIASTLICSGLKGKGKIGIKIQCSGPVRGLDIESNAFGEVKGFLKNNKIQNSENIRSLSSLFGRGLLTVKKYLKGDSAPYSGQIELKYGSIAEDLANYFLLSEQIPTGLCLSVFFDNKEEVKGAGGIFLQAMPGAGPEKVIEAEKIIRQIKSLGELFAAGIKPDEFIGKEFAGLEPEFLNNRRVEFFCRCTKERVESYLKNMPSDEDILKKGPFPLRIRCHHCNSFYEFDKQEIESFRK